MLRIVADENIPYVNEALGSVGEVRCVAGRKMTAADVCEADVLLVRSVTKVNAALLDGSSVKLVGTATIGFDHIDREYLAKRGIRFVSAAGSNSNSVAEYVITSLLVLAERFGWSLAGKRIGIIGVGNIGTKVAAKVRALDMEPMLNDPPLQRATGDAKYVSIDEVLQGDFVTCHVPLTKEGADVTYHLLDEGRLGQMAAGSVVINSSRGSVVDNQALKGALERGHLAAGVLDVWEPEPALDAALLERVALGTPHIAGYSFDGKVNGTVMLYDAVCELLGQTPTIKATDLLPAPPIPSITLNAQGKPDQAVLLEAMTTIYDIAGDDQRMRKLLTLAREERDGYFDQLRKTYPVRREAHNTTITLDHGSDGLRDKLALLGFKLN